MLDLQRQQTEAQRQTPAPRTAGIKPPKPEPYDGKRDAATVTQWLYQLRQYFAFQQVPAQQEVPLAAMFLKGNAVIWWVEREARVQRGDEAPLNNLQAFGEAIKVQFVPVHGELAARNQLAALRQRTTVASYSEEFLTLVLSVPGMDESEKVDRFTRGLKWQVQKEVVLRDCTTLQQAMSIAAKVDALHDRVHWAQSSAGRGGRFTGGGEAIPMELGQLWEFAGQCYNCGTWGHRATECPHGAACVRGAGGRGGRGAAVEEPVSLDRCVLYS